MSVSLAKYFRTLRHASFSSWPTLLRKWAEARREVLPPSRAEICEFPSIESYEKSYAQLAAILGQSRKKPPPNEQSFLLRMKHRRAVYPGALGLEDCYFLTAFAGILAPKRIVEIGTLTGFSAAVLAGALARTHGDNASVRLDTIDTRAQCLVEETRPTGFEIAELVPELESMVRVHVPHDSALVRQLAQRDELELVFIDANHCHPYPLLDLLRLAPFTRRGGWTVLHDIRLGEPAGAQWLFESWPFRKISGGNIGAIQLPPNKTVLIPFALRLMSRPFEITGARANRLRSALLESLGNLA
ncbi:MAG: class I SAM-dependent methyltransferase [Chthoniobacterales bacterium]|nr:class I SAM-dependent methyltransferase [Chthoniobacterales bacterium]